jgi:hypothetical protein
MRVAAAVLVSAVGCPAGDVEWARFNGLDDVLEVQVTASGVPGPAIQRDLWSTTGAVDVGDATVSPGSGPVGTRHALVVDIGGSWETVVDRVSVVVDAGRRGTEEFDLERDSADPGYWRLELESAGDPGEVRTDRFTFRLWQVADGPLVTDPDTDPDTDSGTDTGLGPETGL